MIIIIMIISRSSSGIPDFLSCIPESRFHEKKFSSAKVKISRIPVSVFPYMGRYLVMLSPTTIQKVHVLLISYRFVVCC